MALTEKVATFVVIGILALVLVTLAIVLAVTLTDDDDSKVVDVAQNDQKSDQENDVKSVEQDSPKGPVYNSNDNDDCKEKVDGYYKNALRAYQSMQNKKVKLDALYKELLDAQAKLGVELANNAEYEAWSISDWE